MIYLDNSASTQIAPEVLAAMMPYLTNEYGNASSVHSLGSAARVALEESRETIARAINAEPREIIFTSGGTESDNAAIKGPLFKKHLSGIAWNDLSLLTSRAEHSAILESAEFMEKLGVRLEYVDVESCGGVSAASVASKVGNDTTLVSLMMVNNETGAISPIQDIAALVKSKSSAVFHCDGVQALGKLALDVKSLGVDMMTLSAHKIHGPKGIGALYVRSGVEWEPLLRGGAQERNRRGGTEAVALAVGFAEAVRRIAGHETDFRNLRSHLLERLQELPEVVLNSAKDDTSVNSIVNITFIPQILSRLDADSIIIRFDMAGVAVSNGAACTSGSQQPSHVLLACGKGTDIASKSIRVSFSRYNTVSDIDGFIEALRGIIPKS